MKRSNRSYVLVLGLLAAATVQGQDLIQVYDLALENDVVIREARDSLEAVRETKPQARALLLPSVTLGADVNAVRQDVRSSPLPTRGGVDSFGENGWSISLLQPVYNRQFWYQLEQADNTIAEAEAQYAAAEQDLISRTVRAYFNVLAAKDDVTVAKAQTKANQRQLDQAQQRFDVGLIAITDVHEARAAYDGSRATQIRAENQVDNEWEVLIEIIGPHREELAKLGETLPLKKPEPADLETWAETAVQQNYSVIAARNAAEAQRKNIEIQRSGHFPTLDVVGSYGSDRSNSPVSGDVDTSVIGLQFNLPLYLGGAVSSRTRQAHSSYAASQEALDRERRSVNRQVRNAYRGVITSISEVEALKATTISSQSALESTQAGYEVGTRTLVDVLTVQSSMFDAQRNYLGSRYEYIINGLDLKLAASSLSREDLERASGWLEQ